MVTAIDRSVWQDPAKPITGPPRRQTFRRGVVHHEGAVGRTTTPADIPRHLRATQAGYLASRGYSLGYGFAVVSDVNHPADGTRWEIRGTHINMASNPGRKWNADGRSPAGNVNDWTGSVLIIGPWEQPPSPKAAASVRTIFAEWHAESGTAPVRPYPHSVTDYTSCCGNANRAALAAGLFDPTAAPQPEPPKPPPPTPLTGVPDVFHPIIPFRNSDTRVFGGPGIEPIVTHRIGLHPAVLPAGVVAVALNAVIIPNGIGGFATAWPDGERPNASFVNYLGVGATDGSIVVGVIDNHFSIAMSSRAHVICDISGYWTA